MLLPAPLNPVNKTVSPFIFQIPDGTTSVCGASDGDGAGLFHGKYGGDDDGDDGDVSFILQSQTLAGKVRSEWAYGENRTVLPSGRCCVHKIPYP